MQVDFVLYAKVLMKIRIFTQLVMQNLTLHNQYIATDVMYICVNR